MKNKLFTGATLVLFFTPALVVSQDLSDYCHVYLIDMKVAEKALMKYPTGNDQQDTKLLSSGTMIVGRFSPKIAEEELTTKNYQLPRADQIITASVFYTDGTMFSSRSNTVESMWIGIAVSKKAQDSAFEVKNNAVAEITYTEHTDTIRVKTQAHAQGRQWLVGLECRCHREFDETDPKKRTK
ncbi:MAG TPA: hypothetical protein VI260_06435 [Blastocatellia bacterium]|jgi:hypothetical protein